MNILVGSITEIQTSDALSLLKIAVGGVIFTSIVIDTPKTVSYLNIGSLVRLYFKETEVILSKGSDLKISLQNRIPCEIATITKGLLLSEIAMRFGNQHITSIITTNACVQLDLQENDRVVALVKTNEISVAANA